MPRIFDNISARLLPAIQEALKVSRRADFAVGYFNLRGWRQLAPLVDEWAGGPGSCCRLLVGMHRPPEQPAPGDDEMDNATANRLRKRVAESFREQLAAGAPTNADEAGLRQLARQLRESKLVVKLFLRYPLHAKLYLAHRDDKTNPVIGYLGSSNLTYAGLAGQGELNVDVMDHDACGKLVAWFEDRWRDQFCVDVSKELAEIIDESWAREVPPPPHHIYVKMAYHLSNEARKGVEEFRIPPEFDGKLFEFQKAAVKIAARHLDQRGGVLIGDVVGLGKTLMATAVARIFEETPHNLETLILCPKNLVPMWEDYKARYRMRARVLPISMAQKRLTTDFPRYRVVLIDESHNLRNREGGRYRAIKAYVERNDCKCILLSATPYNKSYLDLGSQLRLFLADDGDVGVRPERLLRDIGETEFVRRHQCGVRTLAAFEKSEHPDDWRELMRLFMVRRTRGFIEANYAETDPATGRKFLTFPDGRRSYFPRRDPLTARFPINDADPADQYARLYGPAVVDAVNRLALPRYGLGNYAAPGAKPNDVEARVFGDLSRAGHRLMGFCRTNLFKRLESSGQSFLDSVGRHLLRNYVYLHALQNRLPVPIGTQESELLDQHRDDEPADAKAPDDGRAPRTEAEFAARAAVVYAAYSADYRKRFKWVRADQFDKSLAHELRADNKELLGVLATAGAWDAHRDAKLNRLEELLTRDHPGQKVLVFSQFSDTVHYLEAELRRRKVAGVGAATGRSANPTDLAKRFSPVSNGARATVPPDRELRVLLATDVLSEGQNLQDCAVVVNYDLPWAIIRLIQRAGRVDRIGQQAEVIRCYSFLPAEGVERIIQLRSRVRDRLKQNAEVVGTDEAFFEDDGATQPLLDLYHEKAGVLDGEADAEVDLASYAYQIWKNATDAEPGLAKQIEAMPNVVYSAKAHAATPAEPPGVLVYSRTAEGYDALSWVGHTGKSVTESQFSILRAAACNPGDPCLPRAENHHELVQAALDHVAAEEKAVGGQLGRPSGARFRVYERLTRHSDSLRNTLLRNVPLEKALADILRFPLKTGAADAVNRLLKSNATDEELAGLVVRLRDDNGLCVVEEDAPRQEAQIVCSLGLIVPKR